jgi:hypothetical protein
MRYPGIPVVFLGGRGRDSALMAWGAAAGNENLGVGKCDTSHAILIANHAHIGRFSL